MELKLPKECSQLTQIGKSNNSQIYKELDKNGSPLQYALKLIIHSQPGHHSKECSHLHNEHRIMAGLSHPHILTTKHALHENKTLKGVELCAIELELAETDLFDKMQNIYPQVITPTQIRELFLQILSAVKYLHEQNIAHNDIKLENIFLFNGQKTAKLADFGFARDFQPPRNAEQQKNDWMHRCKTMLAPEILAVIKNKAAGPNPFDETKSDIFALGVTLFQSLFLRTPFAKDYASANDPMFRHFFTGQNEEFWQLPEIQNILKFLSKFPDHRIEQFMDLINKMVCVNPQDRLNIDQVIQHPWFTQ